MQAVHSGLQSQCCLDARYTDECLQLVTPAIQLQGNTCRIVPGSR